MLCVSTYTFGVCSADRFISVFNCITFCLFAYCEQRKSFFFTWKIAGEKWEENVSYKTQDLWHSCSQCNLSIISQKKRDNILENGQHRNCWLASLATTEKIFLKRKGQKRSFFFFFSFFKYHSGKHGFYSTWNPQVLIQTVTQGLST